MFYLTIADTFEQKVFETGLQRVILASILTRSVMHATNIEILNGSNGVSGRASWVVVYGW